MIIIILYLQAWDLVSHNCYLSPTRTHANDCAMVRDLFPNTSLYDILICDLHFSNHLRVHILITRPLSLVVKWNPLLLGLG